MATNGRFPLSAGCPVAWVVENTVRLLDLYCGAGGAAVGYARAGFEVVGVDIKPQPHYPFPMYRMDALNALRDMDYLASHGTGSRFDVVHASPPCQHYANVTRWRRHDWNGDAEKHPALIAPTRAMLQAWGGPYVIENVRTPELHPSVMLCGTQFGLPIRRHRYFETNIPMPLLMEPCRHRSTDLAFEHKQERAYGDAMGCEWMVRDEHREAIPPAYTEWIGARILEHLGVAA